MDLGKTKYGGPFTTEEVEDVKTCLRMQVVILSTLTFFIPGELYLISKSYLSFHFQHKFTESLCFRYVLYSEAAFAMLIIPLYELVVYPIFRNRIPSTIKRLGIGSLVTIALIVAILSTDTAGHLARHYDHMCIFSSHTESETLPINYLWVVIPSNLLAALQTSIFFISLFEFT